MTREADPHAQQPVLTAGEPLATADAVMIMIHGRGASAENILGLADSLDVPGYAFVAPQAAGNTWYPYSFLQPIEQNEPFLTSALSLVAALVDRIGEAGHSRDRIVLLGFSQGACLSLEFAARHPARYGGVIGLSGGVIGPPGTPRDYAGSLEGTPIFLGSSDPDPHIPVERVYETDEALAAMGASVTTRIYPGLGHTIGRDEVDHARALMQRVIAPPGD